MHLHIGNNCFLRDSFFLLLLLCLFFDDLLLALESVEVSLWFFLVNVEFIDSSSFKNFVPNRLKWPKPLQRFSLTQVLPLDDIDCLIIRKNFRLKLFTNVIKSCFEPFILDATVHLFHVLWFNGCPHKVDRCHLHDQIDYLEEIICMYDLRLFFVWTWLILDV